MKVKTSMTIFMALIPMSRRKLQNYLRTHRKRTGLSQREIAFLLGVTSSSKVSRYEHFLRQPTLRTAFAYEIIFGVPAHELFAGIFQEVEAETLRRIQSLQVKLKKTKRHLMLTKQVEGIQSINPESKNNLPPNA